MSQRGEIIPEKLGGGVQPASQNPYTPNPNSAIFPIIFIA